MRNDILVACNFDELNMHTPVFNLAALSGSIPMQIPKHFCHYQLYEIHDISRPGSREVNFYGKIRQDRDHPWLDIPTEILDLKSGKHTYRFDFLDPLTNCFNCTFISYIIQDDNPETPYVYMGNRGNPVHEDNTWKDGKYSKEFMEDLRKDVEATYGYDPLIFGYAQPEQCQTCALPSCENCPFKEV